MNAPFRTFVVLMLAGLLATVVVPSGLEEPAAAAAAQPQTQARPTYQVLVFHRTVGQRHPSIDAGIRAIRELGRQNGFSVHDSKNPFNQFTDEKLDDYRVIVFLNTTGDVLTGDQEAAFERWYRRTGGGFVGIHSAIETEIEWPFLTDILGTRATGTTSSEEATIRVADRVHSASEDLPEYWTRTDQWYNFAENVRGVSHVLATLDEATVAGGTMGPDHPVAWCKDYQGGRSFYTAGGDTTGSYAEPGFRSHLLGAIQWAAAVPDRGDCGATVLANYEMSFVAAPPNISEPIGFDVLPDGRVIQTDRRGGVRLHDPVNNTTTLLAQLPVYIHSEDGMYGPAVDNEFAENNWVYLYYAPLAMDAPFPPATPEGNAPTVGADPSVWDPWLGYFQLSRFRLVEATATELAHLDLASEQKILKVPVNRGACCHVAGDITFDSDNNLWIVTGDDTPAGGGNSGGFSPFNDMMTNESQTVALANATGGSFTLTFDGQTTTPIGVPIDNAAMEGALEALANVDDVAVTGTGTRTVSFRGSLSQTNVAQMTADGSGLVGEAPTVTVATSLEGAWFNTPHVDARRSSLNTNDLRGKILRITVAADGSYTVPDGNLFEDDDALTRPEIYAMGFRNPFRITLDENDDAYITDYSPDSSTPQVFRGPAGTGRMMVVREPANYGWPLCYSPELPYYPWNFNTSTPLLTPPEPFECDNPSQGPENTSRWNTGLTTPPPISEPEMWYSFQDNNPTSPLGTPCPAYYTVDPPGTCPQLFPELLTGGVGPHGAARYDYDPDNPNPTKFPEYFDEAIFFGEFTRDFLREIRLDENGDVFKINNLLNCGPAPTTPARPFICDNPMDMMWGEDGTFYLLTYGDGFFNINPDAALVRFSYVKGLRSPIAVVSATPTSGQEPLTVEFSSLGTRDPDPGDSISFEWDLDGDGIIDSVDPNPTFTYTETGVYVARLTVTDSSGRTGSANTTITVGNTAPTVDVTVPVAGGVFAFGENIPFQVNVSDPEDGTIDCDEVEVTFVLGHDEHGHAETTVPGCTGLLPTFEEDVAHGGHVFGIVSASYTDHGGDPGVPPLTSIDQHQINQKRQQVEFVTEQSGTNTAPTTDEGGGFQRGSLGNGDWIALNSTYNLLNVDSLTFRTSGGSGPSGTGAVEIHLDSVDGPIHSTVTIAATPSPTTYASQTFPLTDPGGSHRLYLVFRPVAGGPGNNFFNLNWVEFGGAGVGLPPP